MSLSKKLALLGLMVLSVYFLSAAGKLEDMGLALDRSIEAGRMKNVSVIEESPALSTPPPTEQPEPEPENSPLPAMSGAIETARPAASAAPLVTVLESHNSEEILETTIQGGLSIKNETSYQVDAAELLAGGPGLVLPLGEPQILIMHTHGSEAYTQAGLDRYESSDNNRTEDTQYNIVRIGDELTKLFEKAGLNVLHDREIYDYPSYTGSYTRSGEAVAEYLRKYPSIVMVLDVHRDALGADGVIYKTIAEEDGVCASQIMMLVGSDASGLEHPQWKSNLALALYLQNAIGQKHPTLMRPVSLVNERYNQHLTRGSIILEVGSSGNTLQEALAAIRLFAEATAPALLELTEAAEGQQTE